MVYKNNPFLSERILLAIDIETVQRDDDLARQFVADGIKPSANMSKPETLAEWHATRKPALIEEALAKGDGALSAVTCKIACIGLVHGTSEQVFCSADEDEVLRLAYEYLSTLGDVVTYIGHNIAGFDLPYLRHRSIVNRRKPPLSLRKAFSAKPWEEQVVGDTMLQWSHDRDKRISLDRLCRLLGIESPKANGIDGSAVYGLYTAGKLQDIADYCLRDCRAALAVYNRIAEVA
jgi:3'-5' exonuclease